MDEVDELQAIVELVDNALREDNIHIKGIEDRLCRIRYRIIHLYSVSISSRVSQEI